MACLAPDTSGDGTGCDNMTAVIVQFKPLLVTEYQKNIRDENVADAGITSTASTKRSLSSTDLDEDDETESKRLKVVNKEPKDS